jgi:3-isopropylmalate/(R)-2-methylmalate dehydratase small subunit
MDRFTVHTGTAVPLRRSNVDTDQIIPAVYLKRITRTGFEDGLFSAWRANEPDFVLNRPTYQGATILVAGPDFGTGSSREHAVWALVDYGFRVVISERFGDIFRNNSTRSGLVPAQVSAENAAALMALVEQHPETEITVDVDRLTIEVPATGLTVPFTLDPDARDRLLKGLDDIGLTLGHLAEIDEYESHRLDTLPSLF